MSKRYGRNQKRRDRARIAELEARERLSRQTVSELRDQLERKYTIENGIRDVARHMGEALGEGLRPHAEKLMAMDKRRDRHPIAISIERDVARPRQVTIIRGVVDEIRWNYAVNDW